MTSLNRYLWHAASTTEIGAGGGHVHAFEQSEWFVFTNDQGRGSSIRSTTRSSAMIITADHMLMDTMCHPSIPWIRTDSAAIPEAPARWRWGSTGN